MDGQQDDRAGLTARCASCGAPLRADAAVCGSCGRAVARPAVMDTSTVPATAPASPPPGALETTWPAAPPASHGALAGIASLAATPVAMPASRRPRAGLMATVAAFTLLAVLGGGAYWVFANFIHAASQTDTARYVPDSAVFFASVDLVAISTNSHHFNLNDTMTQSTVTQTLKRAVGLDWKTDVQPWAGRIASVAAFPSLSGATTGSPVSGAPLAVVVILQSRDDGAATAAIDKGLAAQSGANYAHGTYDNFTQRSAIGDAATFEIGSGLVIFSSTQAGAHMVVDRVNGHGATLAGNSEFIRAVADLPSDRYGTVYFGLSALVDPLGTGGSGVHVPFLDTYPTIAGSLAWTDDGMRAVTNLKPVRSGVPRVPLNGDTTALAALVPADASFYAGAARGGPLADEFVRLVATGTQTQDPVRHALGVDASDPALAQPAAVFITASSGSQQRGGLLLRAPDAGAASALLAKTATHNKWTSKAISVSGTPATEYDATTDGPAHAIAVSLMVQGTLVLVDSTATAQAVLAVASGGASLAHAANFQRLEAHAPAAHAVTLYVDTQTLSKVLGVRNAPSGTGSSTPLAGLSVNATLLTLEWTTDQLRLTGDSLLAG